MTIVKTKEKRLNLASSLPFHVKNINVPLVDAASRATADQYLVWSQRHDNWVVSATELRSINFEPLTIRIKVNHKYFHNAASTVADTTENYQFTSINYTTVPIPSFSHGYQRFYSASAEAELKNFVRGTITKASRENNNIVIFLGN